MQPQRKETSDAVLIEMTGLKEENKEDILIEHEAMILVKPPTHTEDASSGLSRSSVDELATLGHTNGHLIGHARTVDDDEKETDTEEDSVHSPNSRSDSVGYEIEELEKVPSLLLSLYNDVMRDIVLMREQVGGITMSTSKMTRSRVETTLCDVLNMTSGKTSKA